VRTSRRETKGKQFLYFLFYRLFFFLADSPVQMDSGDFCVMSRWAAQLLLSLPEKLRFVRGLRAWLRFSRRSEDRDAKWKIEVPQEEPFCGKQAKQDCI
jgi:dolichol-phosphate mannosyltransferase